MFSDSPKKIPVFAIAARCAILSRVEKTKLMPTLDFKGKSFVYTHHLSVPFRELIVDAKKSELPAGTKPSLEDNLIIHGDKPLSATRK